MKSVVDLFVVKDRTAIFWFVMACISIVFCAIFVQNIIATVSVKPQYVIMDQTGTYYLVPSVEFEKAKPLHIEQTRIAMETLYTRNVDELKFASREKKLFLEEAIKQIRTDILVPDEKPFKEQKISQTIEVEDVSVLKVDPRGIALTKAKGKLTRKGTFKGQQKTETLSVETVFWWRLNARMADNGAFPTVCYRIKAGDPKKGEVP